MKGIRVAYLNGEFLPESEVNISFRDRGFVLGDAVFDAARTLTEQFSVLGTTLIVFIGHLKRCRSILEFLLKK